MNFFQISVLKSFYENTDDLKVIQEASIDDSKLNTIQVKIIGFFKQFIKIWL